tara:strand:- start:2407 stop:3327 length:921 start_codon:yes stop_codon:yes gene_type:complete
MKNKVYIILFTLVFFFNNLSASENKILFKIDNEIITTVDILNEINYLNSINNNLEELEKDKIFEIAKNSLIRDKIKELVLLENFNLAEINEKDFENLIISNYASKGLNTIDNVNEYLRNYNLDSSKLKKKISINAIWNQMIFEKFSKNIQIDLEKIKEDLLSNNQQKEFFLSEIVFTLNENENLLEKFSLIQESISEKGFSNSALLYSISDTSNKGGELGWISESSINEKIKKELIKINDNEITKPIIIPGGFLILKIKESRMVEKEIKIDEELKKIVRIKTNEQLNQFSNMYLNKLKKNIIINEL